MQVIPYFYFPGNAEEAANFYKIALKAEISGLMRYKDQPYPGMPDDIGEKILHLELIFKENSIYISDSIGQNTIGDHVQVNLNCDTEEQIHWIYEHLKVDGTVSMELQDTFWGAVFGSLRDQYGVSWSFNYQKSVVEADAKEAELSDTDEAVDFAESLITPE